MLKLKTPFKNCGEVCDHCGNAIERGQHVVYTMGREPALYWHAGDCYRLGVKPLDLRAQRSRDVDERDLIEMHGKADAMERDDAPFWRDSETRKAFVPLSCTAQQSRRRSP